MNIGIVTTWFERGAAYVSRQYRDVLKKNHNIYIYARGGENYAIGDPVWDNEFVTWGKLDARLHVSTPIQKSHFKHWIVNNHIELVFFNEQSWFPPVLWCVNWGIKTGAYVDYYTKETVPIFAIYDFLICNTKRHYSVFQWHSEAYYIPWGTDISLFKPAKASETVLNRITFFHSAGMNPERKGTDQVIKAFSQLTGNSKLIVHTQSPIEHYYPELKDIIKCLIENNRMDIIMRTVGAPGLYHLGDVYVYPTRLEGIGLTISEALSCGLPVIVPDNGPMNEFINHNNGKLVEVSKKYSRGDNYYWPLCDVNIAHLTECMQYYIDNFASIENFQKNAREYAVLNLDWEKNSLILLHLFENVTFTTKNKKQTAVRSIQISEMKRKYELLLGYIPKPIFNCLVKIKHLLWK